MPFVAAIEMKWAGDLGTPSPPSLSLSLELRHGDPDMKTPTFDPELCRRSTWKCHWQPKEIYSKNLCTHCCYCCCCGSGSGSCSCRRCLWCCCRFAADVGCVGTTAAAFAGASVHWAGDQPASTQNICMLFILLLQISHSPVLAPFPFFFFFFLFFAWQQPPNRHVSKFGTLAAARGPFLHRAQTEVDWRQYVLLWLVALLYANSFAKLNVL